MTTKRNTLSVLTPDEQASLAAYEREKAEQAKETHDLLLAVFGTPTDSGALRAKKDRAWITQFITGALPRLEPVDLFVVMILVGRLTKWTQAEQRTVRPPRPTEQAG